MRILLLLLIFLPAIATAAPTATVFSDSRAQTSAVIASGDTASGEVDLGGTVIVGLQIPTAFTGTTLKFSVSTASGGTFQTLTDGAGNDVSKTIASSKYVGIDPTLLRGMRFVKVVSGSTEPAARTVVVFSIPAK
jgi:hypothetical protein